LENAYLQLADPSCPGAVMNSDIEPYGPPSAISFGIDVKDYLLPDYTIFFGTGCSVSSSGPSHNIFNRVRSVFCPTVPGSITYSAGPPVVGPYCAPPPPPISQVPENPSKVVGCNRPANVSSTPNSGGADAGSGSVIAGNPCDVSHGNKYQRETDYAGSGNNPLKFVRSYNSLAAYQPQYWQGLLQPFGVAWMASYFQSINLVSVTDSTTTYTAAYALRPDGRILTFNLYQGAFVPDADVADVLVAVSGGFQYHTADDTTELYNSAGQLLSVTARGGPTVTVNYAGGGKLPTSVSDPFGHALTFTYVGYTSQLASIADPAGVSISYSYDTNNNLATVTYEDGTIRRFSYGATGNSNSLTQLTDEASVAYATWTYASGGNEVTGSAHATGANMYSFSNPHSSPYRSVTDPFGITRKYTQQLIWSTYRTTGADHLCAGCGEDASRTYDVNGNVSSRTDFNGVQTTYLYEWAHTIPESVNAAENNYYEQLNMPWAKRSAEKQAIAIAIADRLEKGQGICDLLSGAPLQRDPALQYELRPNLWDSILSAFGLK
jgi:YD repeat-containing protein